MNRRGSISTPNLSISLTLMSLRKPRSWDEARAHPGICAIEYEAPGSDISQNDAPWLVTLNDGWSFLEDMTICYVYNLKDLRGLWDDIVNLPSETC